MNDVCSTDSTVPPTENSLKQFLCCFAVTGRISSQTYRTGLKVVYTLPGVPRHPGRRGAWTSVTLTIIGSVRRSFKPALNHL